MKTYRITFNSIFNKDKEVVADNFEHNIFRNERVFIDNDKKKVATINARDIKSIETVKEHILHEEELKEIEETLINYPINSEQLTRIIELSGMLARAGIDPLERLKG